MPGDVCGGKQRVVVDKTYIPQTARHDDLPMAGSEFLGSFYGRLFAASTSPGLNMETFYAKKLKIDKNIQKIYVYGGKIGNFQQKIIVILLRTGTFSARVNKGGQSMQKY